MVDEQQFAISMAMTSMAEYCREHKLKGVAAILVVEKELITSIIENPFFTIHPVISAMGKVFNEPNPAKYGAADTGANLVGVVMGKISEMIRTGHDSGVEGVVSLTGELGYAGGICFDHGIYRCFIAFSGEPSAIDRQISEVGKLKLVSW
jgi:hypothetical protein